MSDFSINHKYKLIVIGGSAGSFQVITRLLSQIPSDFQVPIAMCLHRLRHVRHGFVEALNIKSQIEVSEPHDKEPIQDNKIYLAPANYHLSIGDKKHFSLSTEGLVNNSRPSIDLLFESAAHAFKQEVVTILLSGANRDGAKGTKLAMDLGGMTAVQDPEECLIDTMPTSALKITKIDHILDTDNILNLLLALNQKYNDTQ